MNELKRECHRLLDGMWDNSTNARKRERGYRYIQDAIGREFHFSDSNDPIELREVYRALLSRAKRKHPELIEHQP